MTNIPMTKTDETKNGESEFWLFGDWLLELICNLGFGDWNFIRGRLV
jgi:hypothetical protein